MAFGTADTQNTGLSPVGLLVQSLSTLLNKQPLQTQLNPDQENQFQHWAQAHPDIYTGPTRTQNGAMIPASLYDMRGAWLNSAPTNVNSDDRTIHYSDQYKMPGFMEYNPRSGLSGFSTDSNFSNILPQYAGQWQGNNFTPPAQNFPVQEFYQSYPAKTTGQ